MGVELGCSCGHACFTRSLCAVAHVFVMCARVSPPLAPCVRRMPSCRSVRGCCTRPPSPTRPRSASSLTSGRERSGWCGYVSHSQSLGPCLCVTRCGEAQSLTYCTVLHGHQGPDSLLYFQWLVRGAAVPERNLVLFAGDAKMTKVSRNCCATAHHRCRRCVGGCCRGMPCTDAHVNVTSRGLVCSD